MLLPIYVSTARLPRLQGTSAHVTNYKIHDIKSSTGAASSLLREAISFAVHLKEISLLDCWGLEDTTTFPIGGNLRVLYLKGSCLPAVRALIRTAPNLEQLTLLHVLDTRTYDRNYRLVLPINLPTRFRSLLHLTVDIECLIDWQPQIRNEVTDGLDVQLEDFCVIFPAALCADLHLWTPGAQVDRQLPDSMLGVLNNPKLMVPNKQVTVKVPYDPRMVSKGRDFRGDVTRQVKKIHEDSDVTVGWDREELE